MGWDDSEARIPLSDYLAMCQTTQTPVHLRVVLFEYLSYNDLQCLIQEENKLNKLCWSFIHKNASM